MPADEHGDEEDARRDKRDVPRADGEDEAIRFAGLTWLLFRLAGRLPDDALAIMRTGVADDELDEAGHLLADALRTGRLPLTEDEVEVARTVLLVTDDDPGLADRTPRLEHLAAGPYTFAAPPPDDGSPDAVAVDEAAIAAAAPVGGLRGLWRVRRSSSRATVTVRLAEVEPDADRLELTAEMQHAIAVAGDRPPRIEVFAADAELPSYHRAAIAAAELVWVRPDLPEPALARVFDGADPVTGPYFAPDHPRLDGRDRDRVLAYLAAAETVLASFGCLDDLLDPAARGVVPVSFRSDGQWIWTDTVAYYLDRHRLAPDPALLAHALAAAAAPPPLSWIQRHRVLTVLTAPDEEPAWQPA